MKKMYWIGNAHLDPVWLWRWQDGYSEVLATFRSALDRMKETPDFKFTSACAVYYQWIEKSDPEMFAEIQERVKEGRWSITGGWFLQPDCNIPTGESFARHTLLSQRYFKDKFGVTATSGYNVDSFGHNASLPMILQEGGMSNYVYMRPGPHEKAQDFDLFRWESANGSAVTAFRIHDCYNLDENQTNLEDKIREEIEKDGQPRMAFFGVGNHGGGPTVRTIDYIKGKGVPGDLFSTVDEYFADVDKRDLPVVREELQHHARGCYSATSYVKAMNRRCEENLLAAERYAVMANRLVGYKYPQKKLNKAWKNVLFNQFHDILAGCSIESAYTDASYLYGETMSITDQTINEALQAICRKIDTGAGSETGYKLLGMEHFLVWEHEKLGMPIVVFNQHAFPVRDTVTIRVSAARITDDRGVEIPFQNIRGEHLNGGDIYVVTFPVEIPAFGYRVYRVFPLGESQADFPKLTATEHSLENDKLLVEFDPASGEIARITDKITGKIIAEGGMSTVVTDETDCDTWAHGHDDLGEVCGQFGHPTFKVMTCGAVRATLRVTTTYGTSTLSRDYTLKAGSDELFVHGEVDFRECHKALKITFPANDNVICDIPYGTVTRKLGKGEEPFSKWFASSGLCIANSNKYGYDSTADQLRMTVLRGAIYADHYGQPYRDEVCHYMDRGPQTFDYSLFAYSGAPDAHRRAALLQAPLRAVNDTFHHGPLGECFEGMTPMTDNVIITAIKKAEDSDAMVVRCLEADGQHFDDVVKLMGREIPVRLTPYSIGTTDEDGTVLNLMEWEK